MSNLKSDITIIGAGSAGLSAALTAAERGAKVIILEKMPFPGGYSLFSEGMFAAESVLQKRDYTGPTRDEAFEHHMQGIHWSANARLVRAFIDRSADTIDWLMQLGVEYEKVWALWPGGPRTWHLMKGGGKALIQALAQKAGEKGVQILTETPAVGFKTDEQKRISGVLARDKAGNTVTIDSRAVIIAGGGFAANKEMISDYTNLDFDPSIVIPMPQTGEHIQMAWEAGAAPKDPNVILAIPAVPGEKPMSHLWAAAAQALLWVNQSGERFCSEAVAFQFPFAANALATQKDGIMYTLFDDATKNMLIEKGTEVSLGVFVPVSTKLDQLGQDIERGIKEGKAFTAGSIEELAGKISVDSGVLRATVDEYNVMCRENYDKSYHKDHRYLQQVSGKKYYAVKSCFHIFTTLGGIRINHKTEVLDKQLETIPGLYAIGNCAGGMYGVGYDIFTSGGALGFAVNSGRIAGENTLEYLGE